MSSDDLRKLESELGIGLPEVYKRNMTPFPVRCLSGNADTDLWDDVAELIERNQQLRGDSRQPWPNHWLFVGDPLSGSANAIDLRDPAAPVVWADHCDLSTVEGQPGEPFEQWLSRWLTDIRSDLVGDGIDPDGDPPPPPKERPAWIGKLVLAGVVSFFGLWLIAGAFFLIRDVIRWLYSGA